MVDVQNCTDMMNQMEQDKRLWNLMAKKLAGESTETELNELNGILQTNPDAGYYMQMLTEWWRLNEMYGPASGAAFEMVLGKFEKEYNANSGKKFISRKRLLAVTIISVTLFTHLLF